MSELPGLFPDIEREEYSTETQSSSAHKLLVGFISIGLMATFGVIAYFGLGPMLAKPYTPVIQSTAPDIAEVLGVNQSDQATNSPELVLIQEGRLRQRLMQRIATEVKIEDDQEIAVLEIIKAPQNHPNQLIANAQNNDILFVVEKTEEAYLYRPSTDEVIASGTVSIARD